MFVKVKKTCTIFESLYCTLNDFSIQLHHYRKVNIGHLGCLARTCSPGLIIFSNWTTSSISPVITRVSRELVISLLKCLLSHAYFHSTVHTVCGNIFTHSFYPNNNIPLYPNNYPTKVTNSSWCKHIHGRRRSDIVSLH